MANEWLRLWHDMPTDPKWRTIARASGQPLSLVQAIYLHMLVDASRHVTRGHVDVTPEDLASALDVTEEQIRSVLDAMQGRVITSGRLTGWDKRQPKKEDHGNPSTGAKSPAERKRDERERKAAASPVTTSHAASRDVTTDKDKDKDKKENTPVASLPGFDRFWSAWPKSPRKEARGKCMEAWCKAKAEGLSPQIVAHVESKKLTDWAKDDGRYVEAPLVYLNQRKWEGAELSLGADTDRIGSFI